MLWHCEEKMLALDTNRTSHSSELQSFPTAVRSHKSFNYIGKTFISFLFPMDNCSSFSLHLTGIIQTATAEILLRNTLKHNDLHMHALHSCQKNLHLSHVIVTTQCIGGIWCSTKNPEAQTHHMSTLEQSCFF